PGSPVTSVSMPDPGPGAPPPRVGFFTDTSVCIGCKACEVACKEWNELPAEELAFLGTSYDNTGRLGATTWRQVAFIEQERPIPLPDGIPGLPGGVPALPGQDLRRLMSSDVCQPCTSAACLEVCPPGALSRPAFGP